jgi:hypothetical protein
MNLLPIAFVTLLTGVAIIDRSERSLEGSSQAPKGASLLEVVRDAAPGTWIAPGGEDDDTDLDLSTVQNPDGYDPNNPPKEMTFHIISGPRKSTEFVGKHKTGAGYSWYLEEGSEPVVIWRHITHGANKSLFTPVG